MKKVGLPLNIHSSDYNNNIHENDPYMINENNELIIDTNWWTMLTEYTKILLKNRLLLWKLADVPIPHQIQKDNRLTIIY